MKIIDKLICAAIRAALWLILIIKIKQKNIKFKLYQSGGLDQSYYIGRVITNKAYIHIFQTINNLIGLILDRRQQTGGKFLLIGVPYVSFLPARFSPGSKPVFRCLITFEWKSRTNEPD